MNAKANKYTKKEMKLLHDKRVKIQMYKNDILVKALWAIRVVFNLDDNISVSCFQIKSDARRG